MNVPTTMGINNPNLLKYLFNKNNGIKTKKLIEYQENLQVDSASHMKWWLLHLNWPTS